ncbi:YtxH domain-containing protein [Oceanobacillus chungangensis]|uniref:YtxH domain-containing protein n=1 Tax=Oceanobacillus chungangensis TaxID=1229152 RepID=A0A3D8PM59_9BACI|nr:YtxH domain-containing protein [Oceanobacillus chungangensis]RDW17206.1 hypothetical protein CWR45_12485 [Oceanobacillus chungangensis]
MGRQKLMLGVIIGAVVGGLATLADKETRIYAKTKLNDAKSGATYVLQNPAEAVQNVRNTVDQLNHSITNGAESTINALEQVEGTLDKFVNKKEVKVVN